MRFACVCQLLLAVLSWLCVCVEGGGGGGHFYTQTRHILARTLVSLHQPVPHDAVI